MEKELKMVSPWILYCKELEQLFRYDPDISVAYEEGYTNIQIVRLYVESDEKAEALMQLLPDKKEFGNITLLIRIVPANQQYDTELDLFRKIFKGNLSVSRIVENSGKMAYNPSYILFQPKIVQYYSDDLSDANGLRTILYQEIAKDIFEDHDGIFFCTESVVEVSIDSQQTEAVNE